MPAYNEEECIADVVSSWSKIINSEELKGSKLLIVNDGSKDNTGKILDSLQPNNSSLIVIHQKNAGHGNALVHGYQRALELKPDWIFQTDSDNQFVPEDFWLLWKERDKSRFILGRRKIRHDALHRKIITRIAKMINFLLFGYVIPDANIPFRLIKADYLNSILERIPLSAFAPNIFISVVGARDGENTLNIPVTHLDRTTGTVSILRFKLIKVCMRSFIELLKFRVFGKAI